MSPAFDERRSDHLSGIHNTTTPWSLQKLGRSLTAESQHPLSLTIRPSRLLMACYDITGPTVRLMPYSHAGQWFLLRYLHDASQQDQAPCAVFSAVFSASQHLPEPMVQRTSLHLLFSGESIMASCRNKNKCNMVAAFACQADVG